MVDSALPVPDTSTKIDVSVLVVTGDVNLESHAAKIDDNNGHDVLNPIYFKVLLAAHEKETDENVDAENDAAFEQAYSSVVNDEEGDGDNEISSTNEMGYNHDVNINVHETEKAVSLRMRFLPLSLRIFLPKERWKTPLTSLLINQIPGEEKENFEVFCWFEWCLWFRDWCYWN